MSDTENSKQEQPQNKHDIGYVRKITLVPLGPDGQPDMSRAQDITAGSASYNPSTADGQKPVEMDMSALMDVIRQLRNPLARRYLSRWLWLHRG